MAAEVRKNEEEIERLRLAEQEVLEQTDEWKAKVKIYFFCIIHNPYLNCFQSLCWAPRFKGTVP